MSQHLYESMAAHPDIAVVMELLELVEPVDEFSRALCLVRDCFSPSDTLRLLSRNQLRGLMKSRMALMTAFETAVMDAAKIKGVTPKTFSEAHGALEPSEFNELVRAYKQQVDELMSRPLK